MTRRDRVYLVGKRAALLDASQSFYAWQGLAAELEEMGDMDLPKFKTLLAAIRSATIQAKQMTSAPIRVHRRPSAVKPFLKP